jgi:outer membrane immunogenic protein
MDQMKKFLIAAAGLVALAVPALAADMPVKASPPAPLPEWTWTGFYVGVEGGGAWGSSVQSFVGGTTGRYDIHGWEGGGTLGYNWQVQHWVFGIEGDISDGRVRGTTGSSLTYGCGSICATKVEAFDTVRGRVGYAFNKFLLYGTGGMANGQIQSDLNGGILTHWRTGWTAGAGAEYSFAPHWSAKLEWLYVNFHNYQWTNVNNGFYACAGVNCTTDARFNVVRAGINYTFGGPVVAKY